MEPLLALKLVVSKLTILESVERIDITVQKLKRLKASDNQHVMPFGLFMDHLYLKSQIVGAIVFLMCLFISRRSARTIFLGGFLALPLALVAIFYQSVWYPDYLFPAFISIEDFIFCFLMGGISTSCFTWFFDPEGKQSRLMPITRRILLVGLFGAGCMALLFFLGIENYVQSFIGMMSLSILLIVLNKDLWKVFLVGSVLFLLTYFSSMQVALIIWPNLIHLWDLNHMLGIFIGYVPLEDIIWAWLFGGTWSVTVFYVTGYSLVTSRWNLFMKPVHNDSDK